MALVIKTHFIGIIYDLVWHVCICSIHPLTLSKSRVPASIVEGINRKFNCLPFTPIQMGINRKFKWGDFCESTQFTVGCQVIWLLVIAQVKNLTSTKISNFSCHIWYSQSLSTNVLIMECCPMLKIVNVVLPKRLNRFRSSLYEIGYGHMSISLSEF